MAVDRPEDDPVIKTSADQIVTQIKSGAPFNTVASQFSQSPSAADGGDIGWVVQGQLPDEVDKALTDLAPGQLVGDFLAGRASTEIGAVVKLFGFWATIGGSLLGGVLILRIGMTRALWYFGALQMLSTLGFVALAYVGHNNAALAAVIALENFAGGLGTAAFVGFMGALTDKRFTATQYALLSSLMGLPRVLISAPAGVLAEAMGWPAFFTFCTLLAIPGLWMIRGIARLNVTQPAPK